MTVHQGPSGSIRVRQGPVESSVCLSRSSSACCFTLLFVTCGVLSLRCVWLLLLPNVSHLCLIVDPSCVFKPCVLFLRCRSVLDLPMNSPTLFSCKFLVFDLVSSLDYWVFLILKLHLIHLVRFPGVDLFFVKTTLIQKTPCVPLLNWIPQTLYPIPCSICGKRKFKNIMKCG